MKTKTGLLALGVFTIAGALTVSCGGSSDSTDNPSTAGSTSTGAGNGSGGNGSAGRSSSAGTTNSGAGTANSGAGTANNNGGTANNNGGRNNTGGFNPGAGGDGPNLPDCPATAETGKPCTRTNGQTNACQVDDSTYCVCQGQNNSTWFCPNLGDIGAGGAGGAGGGLGGTVTCPANAKNGDTCTGLGVCPGSQTCGCGFGTVYCQP